MNSNDISQENQEDQEALLHFQTSILESIVQDDDAHENIIQICRLGEKLVPGSIATVMLLDESGKLNVYAAPGVPDEIVARRHGLVPGSEAGSCGNVIYRQEPMFVGNTTTDLRWRSLLPLAKEFNLASGWSIPIFVEQKLIGTFTGTFTLAGLEHRIPSAFQRRLLDIAAVTIALVLARSRQNETQQKNKHILEQEIVATRKFIQAFFDSVDAIGMVINSAGEIIRMNKAAEQFMGYTFDDVKEQPYFWEQFISEDERSRVHNIFQALHGPTLPTNSESNWVSHSGKKRLFHWVNTVMDNDAGVPVYLIALGMDITDRRQTEEDILRFKRILDNTLDMVFMFEPDTLCFVYLNHGAVLNMGYSHEELLGMKPYQIKPLLPEPQFLQLIAPLLSGEQTSLHFETLHRRKDGTDFPVDIVLQLMINSDGKRFFVAIMRDITERQQVERLLLENEEKFRSLYETSNNAIMLLSEKGFFDCNTRTLETFGLKNKNEFITLHPAQLSPPLQPDGRDSFSAANEHIATALNLGSDHFDWILRRKNGEDFPAEVLLSAFNLQGKRVLQATITDVTQKKISADLLWHEANIDSLTGLPNRGMFRNWLEQAIKKAYRANQSMTLLFIDLDHFKEVNDTLGHNIGDILLIEAARRIGSCVRDSDTVARLGGDEFTVMLSELDDIGNVERITHSILEKLAAPFQLGDERAFISASIGITIYPENAADADTLLKNADQAMYAAKAQGRNCYHYFTSSMQEIAKARRQMANDLHEALADQQFRVVYQPIVTLNNGAIHKAEALIRWQHPTRGLISPNEFIPIAEGTGMIIDIGDWVFGKVANQVALWRTLYNAKFQISINVSPVQFRRHGINFKAWLDYLQDLGLPGQSIVVEITEGLLLDAHTSVTAQLLIFRDADIRVSLDDFGTGYSSLSYLKKFDIDYLKIDQSFVHDLASNPNDMALCEAIIVMAHKLGLKVIAEGIETEEQRALLTAADCDYGQGYLFSKPVSSDEFEMLLKKTAT